MLTVGIGDEYLPEVVTGNKPHNLFHALCIQLVEDVIEQQEGWRLVVGTFEEVELCQFQ